MIRLAFSFVVAVVFGVALGLGLAFNEFARRAIRPLVVALQITPFVAWVPLAVIWFGVTERAVVFVAIVGSFPAMTLATLQAIRQVPPLYERAGRTLGAGGWALYRKIIFPASLPGVMAGLQQAWGFAWKALMAGELIVTAANATGLGHLLGRPGTRCADAARGTGRHPRDRRRRRLHLVRPARPPDPAPSRSSARNLIVAPSSSRRRRGCGDGTGLPSVPRPRTQGGRERRGLSLAASSYLVSHRTRRTRPIKRQKPQNP